jgi:uncharacterized protein (TIGR00369 family)
MTASPYDDVELMADMVERFRTTPIHALLGLEILPVDPERPDATVVTMPVAAGAIGSTGNVHGGAIATAVDVACASAAARSSAHVPTENSLVTADMHVRYLSRIRGSVVRVEAQVVRAGRTLIVVEGRVVDDVGTLVAVADFSAMIVPFRAPLKPELQTDATAPEM